MSTVYAQVYEIVLRIPAGKVLTYGLISHLIGGRLSAQGVGWALKALSSTRHSSKPARKPPKQRSKGTPEYSAVKVPWHRVVNSQGFTSTHKNPEIPPGLQQALLEREGVTFDQEGRLDLKVCLWQEGLDGTYFEERPGARQ